MIPSRFSTRHHTRTRRGNTMILVAGILVLLVILATAFITRTQGAAVTAGATQQAMMRDFNAVQIAGALSLEISLALFPFPIDPTSPTTGVGTVLANNARLSPLQPGAPADQSPRRYGIDRDFFDNDSLGFPTPDPTPDGVPDYPYNFAPYYVIPWTNWPDAAPLGTSPPNDWPEGPGAPNGITKIGEFNPFGEPGFGDGRWVASNEPLMMDLDFDGHFDSFKYWPHLTNISRANNGWRIVRDISNVFGSDYSGPPPVERNILTAIRVPAEQWLVSVQPDPAQYGPFGDASMSSPLFFDLFTDSGLVSGSGQPVSVFMARWFAWTSLLQTGYATQYRDPASIPVNYYRLSDLDADGTPLEIGERPIDAFAGPSPDWPIGSPRWNVERILTDTDGDGYTDAFWFISPTPIDRGIRQIVAVRIVDNCGMLNANLVSPFNPENVAGHTPADLAAFGPEATETLSFANILRMGAFDARHNQSPWQLGFGTLYPQGTVQWGEDDGDGIPDRWEDFLREVGLDQGGGYVDFFTDDGSGPMPLWTPQDRQRYFLAGGQRPFDPLFGLAPFTLAEELELRMYHGSNSPWIATRFERAMNEVSPTSATDYAFLRSHPIFEETSPYYDQLRNSELLHDMRHRLTTYSAARNDEMPPWLWWRWFVPESIQNEAIANPVDADGDGIFDVVERFREQSRVRIDLRERSAFLDPDFALPAPGFTGLGTSQRAGELLFQERLPLTILTALTDGVAPGTLGSVADNSYFGIYNPADTSPNGNTMKLRELAAGLTANILARRDADSLAPLFDDEFLDPYTPLGLSGPNGQFGAIPLPQWGDQPQDLTTRMLGMEKQPFLLEAFVGHVYKTFEVPAGYLNSGEELIIESLDSESYESTVVVVQIANPFDEEIVLYDPAFGADDPNFPEFEIEVFDERVSLRAIGAAIDPDSVFVLPPAREDYPATMILYSIDESLQGDNTFRDRWMDFLDIQGVNEVGAATLPDPDHPFDVIAPDVTVGGARIINLQDTQFAGVSGISPFSTDRDDYDSFPQNNAAIEIHRLDWAPGATTPARVVIDRIDNEEDEDFIDAVRDLANSKPPALSSASIPPPAFPAVDLHPDSTWAPLTGGAFSHWVQFVRATRAWGADPISDLDPSDPGSMWSGRYSDPTTRNPRYINARMRVDALPSTPAIITPADDTDADGVPDNIQTLISCDPRYSSAFVDRYFSPAGTGAPRGVSFNLTNDPDQHGVAGDGLEEGMPWFTLTQMPVGAAPATTTPGCDVDVDGNSVEYARKPTFFDMNYRGDLSDTFNYTGTGWSYPDKGFYHSAYSLQMLQKNGDFEQVGELLNVWLRGHRLEFVEDLATFGLYTYSSTEKTFSENMKEASENFGTNNRSINRLFYGAVIGEGAFDNPFDGRHAVPDLPAGLRLFDAFVCDGPGGNWNGDPSLFADKILGNAAGFTGKPTHGIISLNAASLEVMRALPHWYKTVHRGVLSDPAPADLIDASARSAIAEAAMSYRERFNNADPSNPPTTSPFVLPWWNGFQFLQGAGYVIGPNYEDRSTVGSGFTTNGTRGERGFATPAELLNLVKSPPAVYDPTSGSVSDYELRPEAWESTFMGEAPFEDASDLSSFALLGARVSTDLSDNPDSYYFDPDAGQWELGPDRRLGDGVSGDVEERNLLYAGASNMITARSDTFTVYFKIRSFRQNPVTGVWDATDPEYIVDESRYVMLVDRSEVDHPSQKPKILYMEKLPN